MVHHIKTLITSIESDTRIAFTKKYPFFIVPVIEAKRFYRKLNYTLSELYSLKRDTGKDSKRWFDLTQHSSPLYRKYNRQELDDGKIKNLKIAIEKIDGIVLMPGQIFSFWKHVGRTGEKQGFSKGLVLSDGVLKEDFGGGLCQLSNLLAYMFASTGCEFVERKHHSRDVFPDSGRSIPFASGATVFYNLIDLKVKNTYDFPVRINLRTTETQLRGSLSSPKILDYSVTLEERSAGFFKSISSGVVYRYNQLYRVFYKKGLPKMGRQKIKEELLWENIAKVIYEEKEIKEVISIV